MKSFCNPVVAWYQQEVARLRKELVASGQEDWKWADLESRFFGPGIAPREETTDTVTAE